MILRFSMLLLATICCAQISWNDFNLNGKVQSIKSTTYSIENNQWEVSGFLDSELYNSIELEFNSAGNIISKTNFLDYRGKLGVFDHTIYQYNYLHQLEKQETTLIQNGEEPKRISQRKNFYFLNDQLIRTDEFNFGRNHNQIWVFVDFYQGENLVKKQTWMEDEIFSTTKFTYDLTNDLLEQIDYSNNGKITKKIIYHYDRNNSTKNVETIYGNEKIFEHFQYHNDKLNFYKKTDNQQNLLEEIIFTENNLPTYIVKGQIKQNQSIKFDFKYQYDNYNNWINCVISLNQIPKYKINRYITYF